jgi:hypothetical protein
MRETSESFINCFPRFTFPILSSLFFSQSNYGILLVDKNNDFLKSHQDGWQSRGTVTVPLHQMQGTQIL